MGLREITKEELTSGYEHYLTVGDLKKFLNEHSLPDTAKVVVQRVEDVYYEKHNWGVYLKAGDATFKNDAGIIEKSSMEQYHPAWCCVKYSGDDILFIDLHY